MSEGLLEEKHKKYALYVGAAASVALVIFAVRAKSSGSSVDSSQPVVVSGGSDSTALMSQVQQVLQSQSDQFNKSLQTLQDNEQTIAQQVAQVQTANAQALQTMQQQMTDQNTQNIQAISQSFTSAVTQLSSTLTSQMKNQNDAITQLVNSRAVVSSVPTTQTYTTPSQVLTSSLSSTSTAISHSSPPASGQYYTGSTMGGVPYNDGSSAYQQYVSSGKQVVGSKYV